jgi:hypothetical protein
MPAKGDGITKRKDGRYMARYTVQTPDGSKRKTIYGKQYKEVKRQRDLAVGDAAKGIVYDDENMTVGEYILSWLSDSAKHAVKATTYRAYESQIHKHIIPALGRVRLSPASSLRREAARRLEACEREASSRYLAQGVRAGCPIQPDPDEPGQQG